MGQDEIQPVADKKITPARGQIWQCVHGLPAVKHGARPGDRRVYVETGELAEFRFWHPCNFRVRGTDKEDIYLTLGEKEFLSHFKYVGDVMGEIMQRNTNSMHDIISARLWNEAKD